MYVVQAQVHSAQMLISQCCTSLNPDLSTRLSQPLLGPNKKQVPSAHRTPHSFVICTRVRHPQISPTGSFAPVRIASSRFQSFTAPVSSRCLMCSARLFLMLSSLLVGGSCSALTLLTRRHPVLCLFGPLLPLLSSSESLQFTSRRFLRFVPLREPAERCRPS